METRHKIEMAVAVLIVLMLIAALLLMRKDAVEETQTKPTVGQTPIAREVETKTSEVDPKDIPPRSEVSASTIARTFVERFGSYSSEADYQNVDDVTELATTSFAKELETLADRARASASGSYYGVSTIVLSTKVTSESNAEMTMLVLTQREEAFDSPENTTVRYQDITVDLVKSGDLWLVDDFEWQE